MAKRKNPIVVDREAIEALAASEMHNLCDDLDVPEGSRDEMVKGLVEAVEGAPDEEPGE